MNKSIDTDIDEQRIPKGLAHNAVLPRLTLEEYERIYWNLVRFRGGRNRDYLTALYLGTK
jgi:hypothetical protein